jgi:hypothetical protein
VRPCASLAHSMRYIRDGGTRITGQRIIAKIAILADSVALGVKIIDSTKTQDIVSDVLSITGVGAHVVLVT